MADELGDYKEAILRAAHREAEKTLAARGIVLAGGLPAGAGRSVGAEAEQAVQFLSGYDDGLGTTITFFVLDYSTLDGEDVLA